MIRWFKLRGGIVDRVLMDKLVEWKGKKPLILNGARQVGKT